MERHVAGAVATEPMRQVCIAVADSSVCGSSSTVWFQGIA